LLLLQIMWLVSWASLAGSGMLYFQETSYDFVVSHLFTASLGTVLAQTILSALAWLMMFLYLSFLSVFATIGFIKGRKTWTSTVREAYFLAQSEEAATLSSTRGSSMDTMDLKQEYILPLPDVFHSPQPTNVYVNLPVPNMVYQSHIPHAY